jgi:hypothetical protein
MQAPLPESFCWSRFGTEAGETVDRILERKEVERSRNKGVFLWGIGSAIGPSVKELLRIQTAPEVVFSPISSRPRLVDVSPAETVAWMAARDLEGRSVSLPPWSKVTSRAPTGPRPPRHYALVCHSEVNLRLDPSPSFLRMGELQNLRTNNKVGASQVTAVVRYAVSRKAEGPAYAIALRVRLVAPFFVVLADPLLERQGPAARAS